MSALPPRADMCSALAHVCYGPKADSCGAAKRRKLFALNVCLADNATVIVVFATDMCGEIIEASANRIKAELEKLRCDLRRVDRGPEPVGELCDGVFRRLRRCHHAEPDLDTVILIARLRDRRHVGKRG